MESFQVVLASQPEVTGSSPSHEAPEQAKALLGANSQKAAAIDATKPVIDIFSDIIICYLQVETLEIPYELVNTGILYARISSPVGRKNKRGFDDMAREVIA